MPDVDGRDDLWRVFAYDPHFRETPSEAVILERLRRILPERTSRDVCVGDAEWLSLFTVHRRLATTYRRGRVLIAGDAAHAHAPFGGQGMLTGLGDAENLAFKLALVVRAQAADALIDSYEAERRPLATDVLRATSAVTRVNVASNPVGQTSARPPGAAHLRARRGAAVDDLQRFTVMGQLPEGAAGRARAQAPLRRSDRRYAVHAVRRHPVPTASRTWPAVGAARPARVGSDAEGMRAALRRLGVFVAVLTYDGEEAMLIRPDAHLAWRGGVDDTAGLDHWLTAVLTTGRAP